MADYRCYVINAEDKIHSAQNISRETLGEALTIARAITCAASLAKFELWLGAELIRVETVDCSTI
jgi:hypothetical protein